MHGQKFHLKHFRDFSKFHSTKILCCDAVNNFDYRFVASYKKRQSLKNQKKTYIEKLGKLKKKLKVVQKHFKKQKSKNYKPVRYFV